MNYSSVLSLGGFCQVAHQLKTANIAYGHSPFDWLITPFDSLQKIIDDCGKNFCESVAAYDNGANDGRDVLCQVYNVMYAHEFPLDSNQKAIINRENCERTKSKLMYKTNKFLSFCEMEGRKLFIRLGGSTSKMIAWPYVKDDYPTKYSSINKFSDFLISKFGPDFDILFVTYEGVTDFAEDSILSPNILLRKLQIPVNATWEGEREVWADLLNNLPYAVPVK